MIEESKKRILALLQELYKDLLLEIEKAEKDEKENILNYIKKIKEIKTEFGKMENKIKEDDLIKEIRKKIKELN